MTWFYIVIFFLLSCQSLFQMSHDRDFRPGPTQTGLYTFVSVMSGENHCSNTAQPVLWGVNVSRSRAHVLSIRSPTHSLPPSYRAFHDNRTYLVFQSIFTRAQVKVYGGFPTTYRFTVHRRISERYCTSY